MQVVAALRESVANARSLLQETITHREILRLLSFVLDSTIALSIIRVAEAVVGSVTFQGRDIRSIPLKQLRSQVSATKLAAP